MHTASQPFHRKEGVCQEYIDSIMKNINLGELAIEAMKWSIIVGFSI